MVFTIWAFLFIASASQCLFLLALFLFKKGGNHQAKVILALMLAVCLAININNILYATFLYRQIQGIAGFSRGMLLLLGPLFYLYSKAVSNSGFKLTTKHLWHGLAYLLAIASIGVWPGPQQDGTPTQRMDDFMEGGLAVTFESIIRFGFYIVHILYYLLIARREFVREQKNNHQEYTISLSARKGWLEQITVFFLLVAVVLLFFEGYMIVTGYYTVIGNFSIALVVSVFVYFIAFKSMLANEQLLPEFQVRPTTHLEGTKKGELVAKLEELMQNRKLFKNVHIKLADIAAELNVGQHVLSHYLNHELGKGFFDWINEQRIEEFVKMAKEEEYRNYSITGLATEVGFKSKSSFYTAFKKITGQTPSVYLKSKKSA